MTTVRPRRSGRPQVPRLGRRAFLVGAAAVSAGALAGCSGSARTAGSAVTSQRCPTRRRIGASRGRRRRRPGWSDRGARPARRRMGCRRASRPATGSAGGCTPSTGRARVRWRRALHAEAGGESIDDNHVQLQRDAAPLRHRDPAHAAWPPTASWPGSSATGARSYATSDFLALRAGRSAPTTPDSPPSWRSSPRPTRSIPSTPSRLVTPKGSTGRASPPSSTRCTWCPRRGSWSSRPTSASTRPSWPTSRCCSWPSRPRWSPVSPTMPSRRCASRAATRRCPGRWPTSSGRRVVLGLPGHRDRLAA